MPETVLDTGNAIVNKTGNLMDLDSSVGERQ